MKNAIILATVFVIAFLTASLAQENAPPLPPPPPPPDVDPIEILAEELRSCEKLIARQRITIATLEEELKDLRKTVDELERVRLDLVNMDEVSKWRMKSEEYKRLEKDAITTLDSMELEHGVKTDEESLFDEHGDGIKKEKKAEEIWEDPGFLEF